jgi:argininosuccinate lyase
MGILQDASLKKIAGILHQMTAEDLSADPHANMSDMAFAIEQFVSTRIDLKGQEYSWHVDRSRNDLQACTQLLFARHQIFAIVEDLFTLTQVLHHRARELTTSVMPGYTHYQAAQVISPGFYLTALSENLCVTLRTMLFLYDQINLCPLGAGAMAGQQLSWDRQRMASLLGFSAPQRHSLVAVASREWHLRIATEFSIIGSNISRFITDFITWGSSEYGFIELPDELSAISSAMPQKKNFPLLERIRGKTAHISAFSVDFLLGQRNTPYTNLVEVSKEAGSHLITLFTTMQSMLRLLTLFIERVQFRAERMQAVCQREYLGGFTLANFLTLHQAIPYRTAQIIAGRYIVAAIEKQLLPAQADTLLLKKICRENGYEVILSQEEFSNIFDPAHNLENKHCAGSTAPIEVLAILEGQESDRVYLHKSWEERRYNVEKSYCDTEYFLEHCGS